MISDIYAVRFLLDGTRSNPPRVIWRESEGGESGMLAQVEGVNILLTEIQARPACITALRFRSEEEQVWLFGPRPTGYLGRRFASESETELAAVLRDLMKAALQQRAKREAYLMDHADETLQKFYQRVLFGKSASVHDEVAVGDRS